MGYSISPFNSFTKMNTGNIANWLSQGERADTNAQRGTIFFCHW